MIWSLLRSVLQLSFWSLASSRTVAELTAKRAAGHWDQQKPGVRKNSFWKFKES